MFIKKYIEYEYGHAQFQWSDSGDYAGCGCKKDIKTNAECKTQ